MSDAGGGAEIVVKKKSKSHGGHHGGAWKVAYADFVTALMALFIVLWLLSSSDRVQKAVGGYFQDPRGQGKLTGTTKAGSGEDLKLEKKDLEHLKERLEAIVRQAPDLSVLKDHVTIIVTGEGLRIEMLETASGMFFESGNPKPTASGTELLRALAHELQRLPNRIAIEGHTDSAPFGAPEYSNWELSTDRANAARRIMQDFGLGPDRISQVRGFADQRLRDPSNPTNPSNRRISIIVRYAEVERQERTSATSPG